MATITNKTEFLDGLLSTGLVTETQLTEHFGETLPEEPNRLVGELVKAHLLTAYQATQLLAGKRQGFFVGPYKILRPLGQGGMGTVFLADHATLQRKVALKILSPRHAKDRLSLERFQREARAAAALNHPNIVKLFNISQGAGIHFLVMEYVEGKNLQAFLAETGPMPFAQAAEYIAQAAAGLQHAHERGLIHRDIKPGNLMVGKDGAIKILDMGLTRSFTDEKDDLTGMLAEGQVTGSVDYISPEQAMNQPLDERSDLYSLGATFHALITGEPPFKGSMAQKLLQHQIKEPPSVAAKMKGSVPEALSEVIRKMMAKKPGDRYATANDVIDALGPWLLAATTGTIAQDHLPTTESNLSSTDRSSSRVGDGQHGKARPLWKRPLVLVGAGSGLALLLWLMFNAFAGNGKQPRDPIADANPGQRSDPKAVNPPAVGRFQPLSLAEAGTIPNTGPFFSGKSSDRFVFEWPGVNRIGGIPFLLPDEKDGGNNIIILNRGPQVKELRPLPRRTRLKIDTAVDRFHFLGGVSSYGWRPNEASQIEWLGKVCVVVRLCYQDGSTENHEWKNGEHFADFLIWRHKGDPHPVNVPGSTFAIETKNNGQVRYLTLRPASPEKVIESVEFIKGEEDDYTSPVIVAVTIEKADQVGR